MKKKRRKRTPEEIARSAEIQQRLLERLAYHEAKLEEARTGVPVEPKIRVPTSEEIRARMAARLAQVDPEFRPYDPGTKTMKKRRKRTPEEIVRSAEIQQKLLERLAYYEAKLEEARTGIPVEPQIRVPSSEEVRAQLAARLAELDPDFRP